MPKQKRMRDYSIDATEPLFYVRLSGGLAERNRLPLAHVISVLQRLQEAIREIGKVVQRENGIEVPTGDFGIDLLATNEGFVFRKGSVRSAAAITKDLINGKEAIRRVMKTAQHLEKKRPASIGSSEEVIVPKFAAIAEIQKQDRTKLEMSLTVPKKRKPELATFGERGIHTVEALAADETTEHGLTIYGRLRQLSDRSPSEDGGKYFWGELVKDNQEVWRTRFTTKQQDKAVKLFRQRVIIEGDVTYFRTRSPRVQVTDINPDAMRDYEAAFDELYGCDQDIYGGEDFDTLISEMRGDS
jgi:hypothetical protein